MRASGCNSSSCAIIDSIMPEDRRKVDLYGSFAELESQCDRLVRLALDQQFENVLLTSRETMSRIDLVCLQSLKLCKRLLFWKSIDVCEQGGHIEDAVEDGLERSRQLRNAETLWYVTVDACFQ